MSLVVDASLTLAWVFERGVLTQARSTDFLARLGALPIRTDPASPLETTERITSLGRSFQLSSYDASYLELALLLG